MSRNQLTQKLFSLHFRRPGFLVVIQRRKGSIQPPGDGNLKHCLIYLYTLVGGALGAGFFRRAHAAPVEADTTGAYRITVSALIEPGKGIFLFCLQ
jgi:hypothetical protein